MNVFIENPDAPHFVKKIAPHHVTLNSGEHTQSIMVFKDQVTPWPVSTFMDLSETHIVTLAQAQPELVILGTGEHQHFPDSALLKPLIKQQIGIEIMTNEAACRTFNLLVDDGRSVLLALIL